MMNPMVSGLGGGKMSSSDPHSKIDFLDSAESVTTKVHMAACEDGVIEGNGLLQITKHILIPLSALKSDPAFEHPKPNPLISPNAPMGTLFSINASSIGGVPAERHYSSIEALAKDFEERQVTAAELKDAVSDALNKLLDPIREAFDTSQEWQEITKLAYPDSG
jgi:tyrosyl-tRNA synthetase